jgi:4-carboxymuconolactone decarboxylase
MRKSVLNELTPEGGWNGPAQPRFRPLEPTEISMPKRILMNVMVKVGTANCTHLYRTMFRNFRVYFPFARLVAKMMPRGELSRRQTEIAILRVGWKTRSRYEWGQHVDIGQRAGLTASDILRISKGPDAVGWDECEGAIVRTVDELVDDNAISDATWQVLGKYFNERLIIELLLLVGSYTALAGALNSVGVELEDEVADIMARTPIHGGCCRNSQAPHAASRS